MRICITILVLAYGLIGWACAQAEVEHHQVNEGYTFVSVSNDPWQPENFKLGTYIPTPHMIEANIILDGKDDELEWRRTTEVSVPLSYGSVDTATVKAFYTDTEVFIRVRWADSTEDRDYHPWVWDAEQKVYFAGPQIEDSIMLSFEAGCEWAPSLLAGFVYDFDGWHWLAARSDPVGQAWDLNGTIQDQDFYGKFVPYKTRHTEAEWSVKFQRDNPANMNLAWNELDRLYHFQTPNPVSFYHAPLDSEPPAEVDILIPPPQGPPVNETQTFPQFKAVKLTGDSADVSAKGHWEDGYWTVEFRRKLITPGRMITDSVLDRLYQFSLQVFDHVERIDESSESSRLFLNFLPQEQILVGD